MAEYVEKLTYTADVAQVLSKLDQIANKVGAVDAANEKASRSVGQKWTDAGNKMTAFGSKATRVATLPIAAGFALATKAASDLSEQTNKASVVFGEAADQVLDFSKTAATALGQSKRATLEQAGVYGNLFRAIGLAEGESAEMSKRLLTLTADMASFNNAAPDEVFEALRAGLVGETEPLRKFGVNLNEARLQQEALNLGLAKGKEPLDAAAKAQAAYSLILKDTTLAQGDFARTSDGLANQSRILRARLEDTAASLGEKLIPFALKAASAVSEMLDWFSALDPELQSVALGGAAAVAALGPIISVAGNVAKAVGFLTRQYEAARAAQSGFALGLGGLATAGAVAGLVAVGQGLFRANEQARDLVDTLTKDVKPTSLQSITDALVQIDEQLAAVSVDRDTNIFERHGRQLKSMVELLTPLANKELDAARSGKALAEAQDDLNAKWVKSQEVLTAVSRATGLTTADVERLAERAGVDLAGGFTKSTQALIAAHTEMSTGTVSSQRLSAAQEDLADKVSTAEDRLKAMKTALDAVLGVHIAAEQAAISYVDKVDALSESVSENGRVFDLNSEAGRRNRQAILDVIDGAARHIEAMAEEGASADQLRATWATHRAELANVLSQLGLNKAEASRYLGLLDAVPDNVLTKVDADTAAATAKIDALRKQYEALKTVPGAQGPSLFGPVGPAPARRHGGGHADQGMPYVIGRTGAEELFVPGGSGYIYPDVAEVARMLSAASGSTAAAASPVIQQAAAPALVIERIDASGQAQPERTASEIVRAFRDEAFLALGR